MRVGWILAPVAGAAALVGALAGEGEAADRRGVQEAEGALGAQELPVRAGQGFVGVRQEAQVADAGGVAPQRGVGDMDAVAPDEGGGHR